MAMKSTSGAIPAPWAVLGIGAWRRVTRHCEGGICRGGHLFRFDCSVYDNKQNSFGTDKPKRRFGAVDIQLDRASARNIDGKTA